MIASSSCTCEGLETANQSSTLNHRPEREGEDGGDGEGKREGEGGGGERERE